MFLFTANTYPPWPGAHPNVGDLVGNLETYLSLSFFGDACYRGGCQCENVNDECNGSYGTIYVPFTCRVCG
jgi:hypothetical protein